MPRKQHFGLLCDYCRKCIRCDNTGDGRSRRGAIQIIVWTDTGPWVLTLCGECAEPVRKAAKIPAEVLTP